MRKGYSIVSTPDGPQGPQYELKTGVMLMARVGKVPIVPVSCAADRAWYLNRWDRFMIPKPFAKIVLAVGEPIHVPKDAAMDKLEEFRREMQYATNALQEESKLALGNG